MTTIINNPLFTVSTKFAPPIPTSKQKKPMSPAVKAYLKARRKALQTGSPLPLPPAKKKRTGTTNLGKLLPVTKTLVNGVAIPNAPYDNRKPNSYNPKSHKECFRRLCNTEGNDETVLQFYPFKVIMTCTQESEVRKIYGNIIDFEENTMRLRKGKGSSLYFRYENDAILAKLSMS